MSKPSTKDNSCWYSSLWLCVWLQRQINNKSDLNPSGKGPSTTWWEETTSRVLNPLLVELFWGLHSFWDADTTWNRQMRGLKGNCYWYGFIQYMWSCHMYQCSEDISSWVQSSSLRYFGCSEDLRGRAGSALVVHCPPLTRTRQQEPAPEAWGPDCTWSQSHVATSVSNAFCCCAWLGDGVLVTNYATSVIHTCISSWLCCSWKPAFSKNFPSTWEKPNGTGKCCKTSSAIQATGTQDLLSFCSVYPKTIKLNLWILIFKTLYGLCLMSLKALERWPWTRIPMKKDFLQSR